MIVGFHLVKGITACSTGETVIGDDKRKHLDLLLSHPYPDVNVFYHMDAAFSIIIGHIFHLKKEQAEILIKEGEIRGNNFDVRYIPGKFASIKAGSQYRSPLYLFSCMGQFNPDTSFEFNETADMCLAKAKSAAILGEQTVNAAKKLDIDAKVLTSPIRIFEKVYLGKFDEKGNTKPKGIDLPTTNDYPEDIRTDLAHLAYECVHGGWVESFHKGHYLNSADYDISCFSDDTDLLTPNGWENIKNIKKGDSILTFDPSTNQSEFQEVKQMHISEYKGDMIHILGQALDILVTPNHRILFKRHTRSKQAKAYLLTQEFGYSGWLTRIAQSIDNGNIRIPMSYPLKDRLDCPIHDDMLRIIAWIVTEGFYIANKRGYAISQSISVNPYKCKSIETSLNTMNLHYSTHKYTDKRTHNTCHSYNIKVKDSQEYIHKLLDPINFHNIPLWILQECSVRQLKIFMEILIAGDGNSRSATANVFFTNLKTNADRCMYLCQLLGYRTFLYTRLDGKQACRYHVNINLSTHDYDVQHSQINYSYAYSGIVACPTVDNGYIIAKRNNKTFISGNSAYSHYESELYDHRFGDWLHTKEYQKDAQYGFCLADIKMTAPFHPILYNTDVENHYTPIGFYENYAIQKQELDIIDEYKLGTYEIKDGYWWTCKRPIKPLSYPIKWLSGLKKEYEGFDREFVKRILNGMWGILLQVKRGNQVGEHFNPVWGAYVEMQCRLDVFRFCMKALNEGRKVLHIAVDGVLTDEPVSFVDRSKEKEPGEWRLEANCPSLVISSGCVAIQDKMGKGEFGMDYNWLVNEIKKNPKKTEYPETKLSPMTLAKCINLNCYDRIGEVEEITKTIDVHSEVKRQYPKEPKNGGELLNGQYESIPLDMAQVRNMDLSHKEDSEE